MDIRSFLSKKLSVSELQLFADEVIKQYNTSMASIQVKSIPLGHSRMKIKKGPTYLLEINFSRILHKKLSNTEMLYCLECEVLHELNHALTFWKCITGEKCDYYSLMTLLEYISQIKGKYSSVHEKLSVLDAFLISIYIKKNYAISISEIKSNLFAYRNATIDFRDYLDDIRVQNLDKYIEFNELFLETVDIAYVFNTVVSKTQYVFRYAFEVLGKNRFLLEEFEVFKYLFKEGKLKDIYTLYKEKKDDTNLWSNFILDLFITTQNDYTEFFKDLEFKKYIETLLDEFNKKVLKYHENIENFSVVTTNKYSIIENYSQLKRKVLIIQSLIKKYNLERTSVVVLDNRFNG